MNRSLCLLILSVVSFWSVSAAETNPAVLFVGVKNHCDFRFAKRLVHDGWEVNTRSQDLDKEELAWSEVEKYNVLVVAGAGQASADGSVTDRDLRSIAVIRRFVKEGGGVLCVPSWLQMDTLMPPQIELLRPWGAVPFSEEMLFTFGGTRRATSWEIDFSFCPGTNAPPLLQNVPGLWIPVGTRVGLQAHVLPFQVDESWTMDLTAGAQSYTRKVPGDQYQPTNADEPGVFDSNVPLLAHREVDGGRLVLCALRGQDWLWGRFAESTLEGISLDHGLTGQPSGGYTMIKNTLAWLAEPSLQNEKLGGATTPPEQLANPFVPAEAKVTDWKVEDSYPLPQAEESWPGVVGAMTRRSGGMGSVNEWVYSAKSNGLRFLVFLEDFSQLEESELQSLKEECRQASDGEFSAIPGFFISDEIGNRYFFAGPDLRYPTPEFLSEDGKRFVSFNAQINPNDPRKVKGQLGHTSLRYTYQFSGFQLMAGNFLFKEGAAPFGDWFANYQAVGVITREDGNLLEDATEDYRSMVDSGQGPLPIAIELIRDPAALNSSSWRTVFLLDQDDKSQHPVETLFSKWNFYPDNPSRAYASNGPKIDYWSHRGGMDYHANNRSDFVWQNWRWKVGGQVRSDAGLAEVRVYDGKVLIRRFLPKGKEDFSFVMDLTHNQQHNLTLEVIDRNGRRAMGSEQWDRNQRLQEIMCADRNNQLTYGNTIRESDGTTLLLGGNGARATSNKRVADRFQQPAGAFKNDPLIGAAAFDGVTGNDPQFFTRVELAQNDGSRFFEPQVAESLRLLHTGDVNIGETQMRHNFTDGVPVQSVWHTLWKTTPANNFSLTQRNHFFQLDPDHPLAVTLTTLTIELLRDFPTLNEIKLGDLRPNEASRWVIRTSGNDVYQGKPGDREKPKMGRLVPFGYGAYAAALGSPLGGAGVISLTDGLEVDWAEPEVGQIHFRLRGDHVRRKKGDTVEVSFLMVGIPKETAYTREMKVNSKEVLENFLKDFGLRGEAAYTVVPDEGSLDKYSYPLSVNSSKRGVFRGRFRGQAGAALPVSVNGLRDHWSVYLADDHSGKARPLGVFDGRSWASLRLAADQSLFIGHPVIASDSRVVLQLAQIGEDRWRLEIHNPTDEDLDVSVMLDSNFAPFQQKKDSLKQSYFRVMSGSSKVIDF